MPDSHHYCTLERMTLPQSVRELIESGSLAHLVTLNPDGSPQVTCIWVGLEQDEIVSGHLNVGSGEATKHRPRPTCRPLNRGHRDPAAGSQAVPRRPRAGASRRRRSPGTAAATRPRLPRTRRHLPADGRPARRPRDAHHGRADRRGRSVVCIGPRRSNSPRPTYVGMAKTYKRSVGTRLINALFRAMTSLGLGASYRYVLTVPGRRTGRLYSTPVDVITVGGDQWLVAGYGPASWVRNVRVAGEATLSRGRHSQRFKVEEVEPPTPSRCFAGTSARSVSPAAISTPAQNSSDENVAAELPRHAVFRLTLR